MLTMASILKTLDFTPAASLPLVGGQPSADWLHLYSEAARLAFADRAAYVADPAFTPAPAGDWLSLLQSAYLQTRAAAIAPQGPVMPQVQAGTPGAMPSPLSWAPMAEQTERGTSHISVRDRWGHALAMTTTIEDAFGARLMVNRGRGLVGGFLLNNQLTDFSFNPEGADGKPVANRVQPGKRPRSSMAPTLVFDADSGALQWTGGSPGGARGRGRGRGRGRDWGRATRPHPRASPPRPRLPPSPWARQCRRRRRRPRPPQRRAWQTRRRRPQ
jgi:gamma-glutamyltranspeptidase/glutathione hydrolase